MKQIPEQTTREFLQNLASGEPAPGGGSAAAYFGAKAAALVCKVCNVTIKSKKYADVWKEMEKVRVRAEKIMYRLLYLAESDKRAYLNLVAANRSGNQNEQKTALKQAIDVPTEVMKLCKELKPLARIVCQRGNKNARSDARIAYHAAKLAEWAAELNVKANQ